MVKTKVSIGATTLIGFGVMILGLVPIAAKAVQEGSAVTVNGPERWFAVAGIVLGGITSAGRYLQAAQGVSAKIKVGVTTVINWTVGIAGLLPIAIKSYSEGSQAMHSPEKYAALAGVATLAAASLGRYLQSLKL